MCLDHLGLEGTSFLSMEVQELIQQFRIYNRLNTNFVDRQLESQRGHRGHKQWILDTQGKKKMKPMKMTMATMDKTMMMMQWEDQEEKG